MRYTDTSLTCSHCETAFTFTARDQSIYVANGFATPPNLCPNCRHLDGARPAAQAPSHAPDEGSR
jgi:putative zinc ribbon protein